MYIYMYVCIKMYICIYTPLDKNRRPPSKVKEKILFTIFKSDIYKIKLRDIKIFNN